MAGDRSPILFKSFSSAPDCVIEPDVLEQLTSVMFRSNFSSNMANMETLNVGSFKSAVFLNLVQNISILSSFGV